MTKKIYIQPEVETIVMKSVPLLIGGSGGGDISGGGITPPGAGAPEMDITDILGQPGMPGAGLPTVPTFPFE